MQKFVDNLKNSFKKIFAYDKSEEYEFILPETPSEHSTDITYENQDSKLTLPKDEKIYNTLDVNLEYMKVKYNSLISSDISIREFTLIAKDKSYSAFLIYIDGMINSGDINEFVLKPLMLRNRANVYEDKEKVAIASNISVKRVKKFSLEDYIYNCLMPQNSVKKIDTFEGIITSINSGNTALFVDTLGIAFDIELKGFEHRSISSPSNEVVVRGSQESFVEVIRVNTSLLRRIINNEALVIEESVVGKITETKIAVCYMKNIASDELVSEVKYRVNNLDIDSLISSGQLEQLIQDDSKVTFPQIISTERPDKAANYLLQGRVVVLVNGSPYSLIMPAVLIDFLSSPEDLNIKHQYSNLLKLIRIFAFAITLLLPGLYVAITNYHGELIPTELLFAIAASRESVPFPILFEILIMEFSFELIREAGLRVPSPIGPTIGIVGALILGEAAVSANIVSPILIIIVSVTAICSFTIPDYSLGFTLRIFRFMYIILGYFAGFLGIATGLFVQFLILANLKSFGAPYLSPYLPVTNILRGKRYFRFPIWEQEKRSDFLNTKRKYSQDSISMKWKNKDINS